MINLSPVDVIGGISFDTNEQKLKAYNKLHTTVLLISYSSELKLQIGTDIFYNFILLIYIYILRLFTSITTSYNLKSIILVSTTI